ncbi:MAG: acetylornithine transaminase [Chloroflexi bacterium]|nr:acetylornithine transaminase [Chloroflexota bacterium]MCI0580974.1 acetylornithine transaminase [Chloroflexota bacterium]MCI0645354.1 acetylornithine transaminase [Chloroflexota bacterium]MCI0728475.1 acetylornithine transaminase [Chloroflexota bacterium]
MKAADIVEAAAQYLVPTYARPEVVFTHGQGVYLYDSDGRQYLDFMAGIAVNALGHADPEWAEVVAEQAGRLTHTSNLYHTAPQIGLARRLVENSFADRVFFCNSGSEANEAALKFARKWARQSSGRPDKTGFVAFSDSFHGRSMGALAVTHKDKYREPFAPLVPGVTFATFNDLESAAAAINAETCAVIVEPVQGEGGIHPATPEFLKGLRQLCDEHQALLIFDEVQCGLGRTGHLWAHQAYGVTPDVMTLAKPLAGGLPIGVTLVTEQVAQVMQPGDHGSTFAGGPLVCRAAQIVFDRVNRPEFLAAVRENGFYLQQRLCELASDKIVQVRGAGLLVGLELTVPVAPLLAAAREQGLVIIGSGENVVRLCPPLIINREQIDTAVDVIGQCLLRL